jgi:hypothetical protein
LFVHPEINGPHHQNCICNLLGPYVHSGVKLANSSRKLQQT